MIAPIIGNYGLSLAALVSACGILAALAGGRGQSQLWAYWARQGVYLVAALLTLCLVALLLAILENDFRLEYVISYSEEALPTAYKVAALWAGHSGSLLLWAWMVAVLAALAAATRRTDSLASQCPSLAILSGVSLCFAVLLVFADNPFQLSGVVPPDGKGLNPQLQDWAMIAHPPLLFLGYSACAIPFAFGLGALIGRRTDRLWIPPIRRWVLVGWVLLTAGIVLGAEWAYVELGWGGYWAWDPVENASLLPWFTATALIHSLIVQQRMGMLKRWNAVLMPLTFVLCIFGTYLTRSGVIASVHAFEASIIGWFFLAMLALLVGGSLGVIFGRSDLLRSDGELTKLISFEGAVLGANVLLVIMMVTTVVGTIWPVLIGPFTSKSQMLEKGFYNTIILPMALVAMVLMGLGPFLRFAKAPHGMRRRLIVPLILMHVVIILTAIFGKASFVKIAHEWFESGWEAAKPLLTDHLWEIGAFATAMFIVAGIADDWIRNARAFIANGRRYAGQLVHLGMAMILVGVAGSGLYSYTKQVEISKGHPAQLGRYKLAMDEGLRDDKQPTFTAKEAPVSITNSSNKTTVLTPQRRWYNKSPDRANSEVAIRTSLSEDIYLILQGFDETKNSAVLEAMVKPLMLWIWLGGIAMVAGGAICIGCSCGPSEPPKTAPRSPREGR